MNNGIQTSGTGALIIRKSIKYGLLGNLLLIIGIVIFYFLLENIVTNIRNLSLFVVVIFMFFSVREFRSENSQVLMFWQGIFVALFTFLVFAVVSAVIIYVFTRYIHPQSLTTYIEYKLASLEQYREMLGDERYDEYYTTTKDMRSLGVAMDHLFTQFYIGAFGSAIVAALLRKTPSAV
jgi:predicted membrane protein